LACCSTDQDALNPHQKVSHQERDAIQKLICFWIKKQWLFCEFKSLFLLKFKNIKRALKVAYNHNK
jgi:hypothetical protein